MENCVSNIIGNIKAFVYKNDGKRSWRVVIAKKEIKEMNFQTTKTSKLQYFGQTPNNPGVIQEAYVTICVFQQGPAG